MARAILMVSGIRRAVFSVLLGGEAATTGCRAYSGLGGRNHGSFSILDHMDGVRRNAPCVVFFAMLADLQEQTM